MPDDTTTPKLPESGIPDAANVQAKEDSHARYQHAGIAPAEIEPNVPSKPAPSELKDPAANGKVDEFEVPADIQAWPDEKPVISKEDEDRLLKVALFHSIALFGSCIL